VTSVVGLLAGITTLLAGLFALELYPIAGTLITLAAMARLLSSAAEFCQAQETDQPNLQEER
jgi:hypothetical protein